MVFVLMNCNELFQLLRQHDNLGIMYEYTIPMENNQAGKTSVEHLKPQKLSGAQQVTHISSPASSQRLVSDQAQPPSKQTASINTELRQPYRTTHGNQYRSYVSSARPGQSPTYRRVIPAITTHRNPYGSAATYVQPNINSAYNAATGHRVRHRGRHGRRHITEQVAPQYVSPDGPDLTYQALTAGQSQSAGQNNYAGRPLSYAGQPGQNSKQSVYPSAGRWGVYQGQSVINPYKDPRQASTYQALRGSQAHYVSARRTPQGPQVLFFSPYHTRIVLNHLLKIQDSNMFIRAKQSVHYQL